MECKSNVCWSSLLRALQHAGGTSTQPPSSGQRCLCLEGEPTALVPSTPTTRSTATRSKCSTQRPTAGWVHLQHSLCQRDAGAIQPVRHTHMFIKSIRWTDFSLIPLNALIFRRHFPVFYIFNFFLLWSSLKRDKDPTIIHSDSWAQFENFVPIRPYVE